MTTGVCGSILWICCFFFAKKQKCGIISRGKPHIKEDEDALDELPRNMIEIHRKQGPHSASTVLHYAGKEKCVAGQSFGPAQRAQYLLHFITEGRGTFHVGGQTYELHANQVFLIKPGEMTVYQADPAVPWSYMWFAFSGMDADIILQNCGLLQDVPYVSYPPDERLNGYLESIIDQMQSQTATDYDILADMFRVFAYLTRCYRSRIGAASSNPYVAKAVDFISNNYQFPISVSRVADFVGVERTYLYRLFKSELNTSPKRYLNAYRLQVARDLLTNTRLSIETIAQRCGFPDSAAFSKVFAQYSGLPPLKYRKMDGQQYLAFQSGSREPE